MIRANIKNSKDVYIGLIDEDDDGFRIVWNKNIDSYPEYNYTGSDQLFQTYEKACQCVYKVSQNAKISETINFRPKNLEVINFFKPLKKRVSVFTRCHKM
jgi:hypothetical protein